MKSTPYGDVNGSNWKKMLRYELKARTSSSLFRSPLSPNHSFIFQSGQLNEYTDRKDMSADVVCMALASVPSEEQRSRFLAVGLADNTVRIISLDPSVSLRNIHTIFQRKSGWNHFTFPWIFHVLWINQLILKTHRFSYRILINQWLILVSF